MSSQKEAEKDPGWLATVIKGSSRERADFLVVQEIPNSPNPITHDWFIPLNSDSKEAAQILSAIQIIMGEGINVEQALLENNCNLCVSGSLLDRISHLNKFGPILKSINAMTGLKIPVEQVLLDENLGEFTVGRLAELINSYRVDDNTLRILPSKSV